MALIKVGQTNAHSVLAGVSPNKHGSKQAMNLNWWLIQKNKSADMDAATAKLYVFESFVKSCLDAIQVYGARGFLTELEVESEMRDSVGSTLYSGTLEIQRNIITRGLRL
jgi:alkylation response protein AidB-like acyl-CoA dehydrogenase